MVAYMALDNGERGLAQLAREVHGRWFGFVVCAGLNASKQTLLVAQDSDQKVLPPTQHS